MTALFITFDSPHIDRRTLLFAKTLKAAGLDARVLTPYARPEKGFEDIEMINLFNGPGGTAPIAAAKGLFKRHAPAWLTGPARRVYRRLLCSNEHIPFLDEMTEKARGIKADIHIACDLPALPIAEEARRVNGGRLIYDAHEFYTGQITLGEEERRFFETLERGLIGKADLVITVNDDIAQIFKETYGLEEVNVILNAAAAGDGRRLFLHDLLGMGRDVRLVLFQGVFTANRNLENLVRAGGHLERGVLVMLGWGELEEGLKDLAREKGILNKKIYFLPKIPQSELLSYTSSASLGVIPYPAVDVNTTHCTPNKLFEFISAGVPVVANEGLVTVRKFLDGYGIGAAVDMNDAREFATVMDKILSDEAALKSFAERLPAAKKELSWEIEGGRLLGLIRGLVDAGGRKAMRPFAGKTENV